MVKYKLTTQSLTTFAGFQWQKNKKVVTDGIGNLCGSGWLHYYDSPELAILLNPIHADIKNPILWKVKAEGTHKLDFGLKGGCTEMTLIKQIPLPKISTTQRVRFAILCAQQTCHLPEFLIWSNFWLSGENRSKQLITETRAKIVETIYKIDGALEATEAAWWWWSTRMWIGEEFLETRDGILELWAAKAAAAAVLQSRYLLFDQEINKMTPGPFGKLINLKSIFLEAVNGN
jgi:hypothetical protein